MSDQDTKFKRSRSRRRVLTEKELEDYGDYRGAFALKTTDPKKGEYKRKKFRVGDAYVDEEDD